MDKIKPLNDKVLIKDSKNDKTEFGIYIPDNAKERPSEGLIEAVGDDVNEVKVGERVLFVKHGHYELENKDKIIISEEDILAKIIK